MTRTLALTLLAACLVDQAEAQLAVTREDQTVQSATAVLNEIMAVPVTRIPQSMLADAKGVAIVPNVIKGGFVVGLRHGRGVMLVRDEQGGWQPPQFVSLTGGSVGWQAGVQATDVILVFKTQKSVQGLMQGKFTLGVDAAAAAGPVGREAQAATDATLKAEIYSYSRSRGLFAGVSLDGSALQVEHEVNQAYYRAPPAPPGAAAIPLVPASAIKLMATLAQYTNGQTPAIVDVGPTPTPAAVDADAIKPQLADASRKLSLIVDDAWRRYLALPAEVFGAGQPSQEAMSATIAKFDRISREPAYRELAQRGEFRSAHELLLRYQQSLAAPSSLPSLPPPPKN